MALNGKDLELALIVKAQTDQARAQLVGLQTQLQGVEASARNTGAGAASGVAQLTDASKQATAAAAGTADALVTTAAATTQTGETAEQAAARIHAMVQASMQAVDAERARAQRAIEAATASRTAGTAAATQTKSTFDLVAAQNAQMAASSRVVAAEAQIAAALTAKSLTEEQSLQVENMINRARAAGLITAGEQRDAIERLAAIKVVDTTATQADTKALVENTAASTLNNRSRRELGTMSAEFLSGNFGRVRTSGLALANDMGFFGKLLSPVGLAITGVVVALGTLAVAFAKGEAETTAYNKALILTGGYAGQTVGQLQVLAQETAKVTDATQHAAAAAVAAVVQSGKFYGDTVGMVAQAAVAMQQTTGQAVDRTIAEFAKLADEPVKASVELNNATHFLTQAIYDQITALIERGEKDQAAEVAQKAYAEAQITRAKAVAENLGTLETVWKSVASAAKGAWDAMLDIGRTQTPESKIAQLRSALAEQQKLLANAGKVSTGGSGLAGGADLGGLNAAIPADVIKANIARIQRQIKDELTRDMFGATAQRTAAIQQRLTDQAINAQQALAAGAGTSDLQKLRTRLNDLAVEKTKALYGVTDPADRQKIIDSFNLQVADAARHYEAAEKKLAPKGAKGPDLDALAGNAQVAAIQQSLRTLQNAWQNTQRVLDAQHRAGQLSDKDYFDALRKDLDAYTQQRIATLEQEKQAATSHIKTAADRIRADQQVAQIDAEITQAQQDAAAKRQQIDAQEQKAIDDTRKAWLALEASLGVPVDVNTSKAMQKLGELYALVQKLKDAGQAPDQGTVDNMIGAALMTGVEKSPRLRSTRNIPGEGVRDNPLALVSQDRENEQAAFAQQQRQLAQNYAAAQQLAKDNDQKLLQLQQQYQTDSEALANQHKDQMAKIDQAQYWGTLQVASNIFGQLATLSSSQNKKVAAAGKAAAIAGALIDTYAGAVKAYKAGLEVGGPSAPYIAAAYAAVAVATGLANVAQIRSQNVGGYQGGGWTGNAPVTQAVGVVHGREGVLSAPEVQAIGGEVGFNALRRAIKSGYADGGFVHPLANAPSPADLGFIAPRQPRMDFSKLAAANDARASGPAVGVRIVNSIDPQFARDALNTPEGETVIMNMLGRNATKLKQMVR